MRVEPTHATARSPERYTDGPAVARSIERWLGRRPTPSQQYELDVGLERVDGPGSPFAYDEVIVIKGRRCGKTVTAFGIPHARALAGPVRLPNGRTLPFRAVHVAQNLTSARTRFDEDLVGPYRSRFTDDGWKRAVEYKRAAADTALTIDPRRSKDVERAKIARIASELRVLAPSPSAARGAGVFHRTYDEELTYLLERGQQLTSAGRPTMAELFGQAQTWHMSNVSIDLDERYLLWHQREKGRKAVAGDRRDGVCYFEYSLPPGVDPRDESAWSRYYPALTEGLVGIDQLRRDREEFEELHHDGGASFFAEYLGRWADENETGVSGWQALRLDQWVAAGTETAMPEDVPAAIGIEVDPYGRSSTIVAAAPDPDRDGTLVEVLEHGPGSSWVLAAAQRLAPDVAAIGIDDYGPNRELVTALQATPGVEDKLVVTKLTDFGAACYGLEAGVREGRLRWRRSDYHQALTTAAAAAERTAGRAWQWERRVAVSQSPVVAATVAAWALGHRPAPTPWFAY